MRSRDCLPSKQHGFTPVFNRVHFTHHFSFVCWVVCLRYVCFGTVSAGCPVLIASLSFSNVYLYILFYLENLDSSTQYPKVDDENSVFQSVF